MVFIRHRIIKRRTSSEGTMIGCRVRSLCAAGEMSGLIAGYADRPNQIAENEDHDSNCIDTNPFHTKLQLHLHLHHLCLFTLNQAAPA